MSTQNTCQTRGTNLPPNPLVRLQSRGLPRVAAGPRTTPLRVSALPHSGTWGPAVMLLLGFTSWHPGEDNWGDRAVGDPSCPRARTRTTSSAPVPSSPSQTPPLPRISSASPLNANLQRHVRVPKEGAAHPKPSASPSASLGGVSPERGFVRGFGLNVSTTFAARRNDTE